MIPDGNYKPIQDYEEYYLIYDTGQVWSIRSNKFLKPMVTQDGYLYVDLCKHGTDNLQKIHRLVAKAFIPNPNNLPQINHIDEDKTNNQVSNLEWCDAKYNNNYGNHNIKQAKTKGKPVKCIETNKTYDSLADAERQTGIFKSSIYRVCVGRQQTAGQYHWEYVNK